ncbi:TetR family transcriptional regulator [Streptomyces sp. NPDC048415]|uniref:TetR/AcrR family transcriptional regulator n=1 Tax=Streptomyces sp. NPDC048415 TaxID=3154822 RepID=UPI003430F349
MSSRTPTPPTPSTSSSAPDAESGPGPAEPHTPSRRRSQEERRSQAEQSLLDAAVRLFARRGIDQTSLAEVGEEAGYSRGLASHHFGSKAALVERLAQRSQRHFVESLGEIGGHEVRALVALVEAYLTALSQNRGEVRAFYVMWGAALPEEAALRSVFVADDARFRQAIEELVRAGQQNRTVRSGVDPVGVSIALVGQLRGVAAQFLIDTEGVDLDAARTACIQFVHHALTPGPAEQPAE